MPTLQPSAEWIARRSSSTTRDSSSSGCCPEHPAPRAGDDAGESAEAEGSNELLHPHDDGVVGHRGSGGLIRGRAVFCLPPGVGWFQGHVAYTTVGGCSASLGVLGTELPVDPCMQCCHGGFSRHKLVFINHESGKESTLIVERYGGNMMSLHAEPTVVGTGDGPVPPESELSFQTHVMKADEDARALLDRYFQSIVRAASDPTELRDCIVCVGPMDVPLSLLQELAAPQPDSRTQSMVCSAFAPCRETSPSRNQQSQLQQQQQQLPPQPQPRRSRAVGPDENTPVLSPYPLLGDALQQEQKQGRRAAEEPAAGEAQEEADAAAATAAAGTAVAGPPPRRPPHPPYPPRDRTTTTTAAGRDSGGGSGGSGQEGRRGEKEADRGSRPEKASGSSSGPEKASGSSSGGGGGGGVGKDDVRRGNGDGGGGAPRMSEEPLQTRGKGHQEEEEEDVWLER